MIPFFIRKVTVDGKRKGGAANGRLVYGSTGSAIPDWPTGSDMSRLPLSFREQNLNHKASAGILYGQKRQVSDIHRTARTHIPQMLRADFRKYLRRSHLFARAPIRFLLSCTAD
ncbi:hypothetical protein T4A_8934 [Trichinella pseudospiralis]|uniref:Uncharacterized protein n=1 Tax=Trichinella pseudospiralis TaxID=6337 RepID=A0A0V1EWV5_TRIPS|nr:hypothetical protein T4A_8934 [Trichinella pseudospiralis]